MPCRPKKKALEDQLARLAISTSTRTTALCELRQARRSTTTISALCWSGSLPELGRIRCGEDFRGAPMRRPRPISSPSLPRLPGAERCRRRCWHHSPRRGHRNSRTAPGEDEARATRSGGGDPSTDRYIISTGSRSTVRRCRAPAPSSPGGRATAPSEGKAHPMPNTPLSVVLRGGDLERADPYWPPGRVEVLRVGLQSLGDLNESRAEADERRTQGAHRDSK